MSYYVREEDGTSHYLLEDGSGALTLEAQTEVDPGFLGNVVTIFDIAKLAGPTRVSRLSVEVLDQATTPTARVSRLSLEVLRTDTGATNNAGVSRLSIEVLGQNLPRELDVGSLGNVTTVFDVYSMFIDRGGIGPGNGGEAFTLRLNANGSTETATLAANITSTDTLVTLTGDSGLPTTREFVLTIDTEVIRVIQISTGHYRVRERGASNTSKASHTAGTNATWGDSYDQAIGAADTIASTFTADITGSGSTNYPGALICYDSSQAYSGASRYAMHVTEVLGVFPAGTGSSGTNRLAASVLNAKSTTAGVTNNCPAAISYPAGISSSISVGDVAVVRYTNPEATVLDLGPRSVSLQSFFGVLWVDTSNNVTAANAVGSTAVDGAVNGEWDDPSSIGISPTDGTSTPNNVPYTSTTLLGSSRAYTHGGTPSPPNFTDKGWPVGVLAVRQGANRIPFWRSWDWHDYGFIYTGFGTDATYAQMVANVNGLVPGTTPIINLPGSQDITGPDAVWDDGDDGAGGYFFGSSWYVVLFSTPYLVVGPTVGGTSNIPTGGGSTADVLPGVTFDSGGSPTVTAPGTVIGGSGGGINPPSAGRERFDAQIV